MWFACMSYTHPYDLLEPLILAINTLLPKKWKQSDNESGNMFYMASLTVVS